MKKTFFALVLFVLGSVLAGCGGDSAATSANAIPGAPAGAQSGVSGSGAAPGAPSGVNPPR